MYLFMAECINLRTCECMNQFIPKVYLHTVHVTSYLRNVADLPRRFLRISERRSADVREPSAESSLVICGTSVGHPLNVPMKVCAERSKEISFT